MKWLDAARARLRLLVARRAAESRMHQEFRLHIELETEKLMREHGLAFDEARRLALVAFGGVEKHKEALRDDRGLVWLGGFSLDLRLAIRMLARYPWLTLVGCAAMAFGIAAAVGAFEIRTQMVDPSLPLDEGSRIVGFRNWDTSRNRSVPATSYDFAAWRDTLTSIEDLSAASLFPRNLITDDGQSEAVQVAAMTASAFRMARVPPLLGRTLVEADEHPGAPPVIVIGHDIWTRRFSGDPGIVGRTVRLGSERRTVAGVMPEGFAFPATHHIWIPLRGHAGSAPGEGPGLVVFGRLARDTTKAQAQAELLTIGQRTAVDEPKTHEHLRPQLVPYVRLFFDSFDVQVGLAIANVFVVMLLVLVSANVALLMFARAASRESEIAVRSALGASRARIVAQLFVEGLVLAGLAVIVGLVAARFGLQTLVGALEAEGRSLPFWRSDSLTATTVIYAGALTILSAALISVIPALKVTSRGLQARLRQSTAGGGGFRFGGVWTLVIAAQVAATLAFPAAAFFFHRVVVAGQTGDIGFSTARYLSARLEIDRGRGPGVPMDTTEQAFGSRLGRIYTELERRVASEPQVAGLTFADQLPGTSHPRWWIEVEGVSAPPTSAWGHPVSSALVSPNFFDVLGAPILAGRAFAAADLEPVPAAVIVNQSFVSQVLVGQNPVGRRIRRVRVADRPTEPGPWLEIVGVVRDLGMGAARVGLYQPIAPDAAPVLRIAIGVRGTPESFAARFRAIAREVEPTLQIHDLMPLDDARASGWIESRYLSRVLALLSAIALLLSLTAIYSVMSFTVSRRTQEIGLRAALGANRRRVIGTIIRRPLAQVGLGNVVGAILVALAFVGLFETTPTRVETAAIAAYAVLMMGVCLLACVVPARRALRIEPASALRVER
jgi:putative ABC transport system permease protein